MENPSPVSLERVGGDRDRLLDALGVDLEHGAELVAAEPVRLAEGATSSLSLAPRRASSASPAT